MISKHFPYVQKRNCRLWQEFPICSVVGNIARLICGVRRSRHSFGDCDHATRPNLSNSGWLISDRSLTAASISGGFPAFLQHRFRLVPQVLAGWGIYWWSGPFAARRSNVESATAFCSRKQTGGYRQKLSSIREFAKKRGLSVMPGQQSAGNADAVETGKITSALPVLAIFGVET